jgi:hypothetical protein
MSVYFSNTYWLLGDNADEEAKRWVAHDERKQIVYSSPKAVELCEFGNYLSPELPIPPEGFLVVVISDNEMEHRGLTLGVAHWGGDGDWINPKEHPEDQAVSSGGTPQTTESKRADSPKTTESIFSEADVVEELRKMPDEPREPRP